MEAIARYWYVFAAIGLWWFFLRKKPYDPASRPSAPVYGPREELRDAIEETLSASQEPNIDRDPRGVTVPDQTKWPGWRQTRDGIWFNPLTGEFYSRGTSPPAVVPSAYETGEMVRTDLTDAVNAVEQAYIDNPPAEVFPNAVIY